MVLEKRRELRRMEYTFTDDKLHPVCHCMYQDCIYDDGELVASSNLREVCDAQTCISDMSKKSVYVYPEVTAP